MNKILVIYYSQSGQLTEIIRNLARPFENSDQYAVTYANIEPVKDYSFPWKGYNFFDAFPESVKKIPCEIKSLDLEDENFDLIVFAYSVWYMSPCIPCNSFLLSDQAKRIFSGKPVITVSGVRNMWVVAQEYIKEQIKKLDGRLVGNIVLQDKVENLTSVITISYFLFTGKKGRFLGFFPRPGVSEKDIKKVKGFGEIIRDHIEKNDLTNLQENLVKAKAVEVNSYIAATEQLAYKRVFTKWAGFILKKGGPGNPARKARVRIFSFYLPFAILVICPIEYVFFIIFAPFRLRKLRRDIKYFSGVKLK